VILLDKPLAGKAALVTGGAKRIGRAIALALADAGADVAITYRGSEMDAFNTAEDIRQCGVRALSVVCDVRDELSVQAAVAKTLDEFGKLDLLVNNAGAFETVALEEITLAEWDAMFETNTRGPFLVAKAAYPALKSVGGRILNIGSLGGIHPWATHAHYCTSKAALHMLSKTMAKAWAPDEAYAEFAEKTPMKRNGTAADVAAAALFFCTAPHFITGQLLAVDGGLGL